ncbi:MAG: GNAT family N-acetyltransferase [Bacteroidota bacterium]
MTQITFRPATVDDIPLLRHWDQQPHVILSDPNDDWEWEEEIPNDEDWREQLIAELDRKPIGFMQIMDCYLDPQKYWGAVAPHTMALDIWIGEATELNKGYGSEMMKIAIRKCFNHYKAKVILLDPLASNMDAHRFYERLGFEFVEPRKFGADDCFVYQLKPEVWAKLDF